MQNVKPFFTNYSVKLSALQSKKVRSVHLNKFLSTPHRHPVPDLTYMLQSLSDAQPVLEKTPPNKPKPPIFLRKYFLNSLAGSYSS